MLFRIEKRAHEILTSWKHRRFSTFSLTQAFTSPHIELGTEKKGSQNTKIKQIKRPDDKVIQKANLWNGIRQLSAVN